MTQPPYGNQPSGNQPQPPYQAPPQDPYRSGPQDPYRSGPQDPYRSGPQDPYRSGPQDPPASYQIPQAPPMGYGQFAAGPPPNPGRGLGIAGLVIGILTGPLAFIGLIFSIVGLAKSKKAGQSNGVAIAGIIVSALVFIFNIAIFGYAIWVFNNASNLCDYLPPGFTAQLNGHWYYC